MPYNFTPFIYCLSLSLLLLLNSSIDSLACGNQYVATTGSDADGDGSMTNPYATIQTAINNTCEGDFIYIQEGTYMPPNTIEIFSGINIIGGFDATWSFTGDPNLTIVSGNNDKGVFYGAGLSNNTSLNCMTIEDGYATEGGGIHLWESDIQLINLVVQQNTAIEDIDFLGGGIKISYGSPLIKDCFIVNNFVYGETVNLDESSGGGIALYLSNARIENTIIEANECVGNSSDGGGIIAWGGNNTIDNCIIRYNSATDDGGGIAFWSSSGGTMTITNSSIYGNWAGSGSATFLWGNVEMNIYNTLIYNNENNNANGILGSGINPSGNFSSTYRLYHTTITNNTNARYTIYLAGTGANAQGALVVENSILENESLPAEISNEGTFLLTYSNIRGGAAGNNILDTPSLFENPTSNDYSLAINSPCLGAGKMTTNTPLTDKDDNPRANPEHSNPDLGAFEREGPCDDATEACIWPGNANRDGSVNLGDLYSVGLMFGQEGALRPYPSSTWMPHIPGPDWGVIMANNGFDAKNTDCNSDGIVNGQDLQVILANYREDVYAPTTAKTLRTEDIALEITNPHYIDDLLFFDVEVRNVNNPIAPVMGYFLRFEVNYDPSEIMDAEVFYENSTLGIQDESMLGAYHIIEEGRMDVAAVSTEPELGDKDISGLACKVGCLIAVLPLRMITVESFVGNYKTGGQGAYKTTLDDYVNYELQFESNTLIHDDGLAEVANNARGNVFIKSNDYCTPQKNPDHNHFINRVILANLDHSSGDNDGYGCFTIDHTAEVVSDANYTMELHPNDTNTPQYWTVWMDFNQDDQLDAEEIVFQSTNGSKDVVKADISIPDEIVEGETLMRVVMQTGSAATDPCAMVNDGEIEEYWLRIRAQNCRMGDLVGNDIGNQRSGDVYYNSNFGILDVLGSGDKELVGEDSNFHALTAASNDIKIQAHLLEADAFSQNTHTGLIIRESTATNSRKVALLVRSGKLVLEYRQQERRFNRIKRLKEVNEATWLKIERKGNRFSIFDSPDGITWNLLEEFKMDMANEVLVGIDAGGQDNQLSLSRYSNFCLTYTADTDGDDNNAIPPTLSPIKDIRVAPNPCSHFFYTSIKVLEPTTIAFNLYSSEGKQMSHQEGKMANAGHFRTRFNVSRLPEGIYFLHVITPNGEEVREVVVQR